MTVTESTAVQAAMNCVGVPSKIRSIYIAHYCWDHNPAAPYNNRGYTQASYIAHAHNGLLAHVHRHNTRGPLQPHLEETRIETNNIIM